jgi:hypothetical protein
MVQIAPAFEENLDQQTPRFIFSFGACDHFAPVNESSDGAPGFSPIPLFRLRTIDSIEPQLDESAAESGRQQIALRHLDHFHEQVLSLN